MSVVRPSRVGTGRAEAAGDDEPPERAEVRPFADLSDWRIQWTPIVAGLLVALTTITLLALLGAAIGLTAFNAGAAAAQGAPPPGAGRNAALWGGVSALL
jgi:hypothetical protein